MGVSGVSEPPEPDEFTRTGFQTRRTCPALWVQILQPICAIEWKITELLSLPLPPFPSPFSIPTWFPVSSGPHQELSLFS